MVIEKEIKDIKEGIEELKSMMKSAGFSGCGPARVYEINKKAKNEAEKIRERLNVNKREIK
ncbi:MAG TPA: hypothetical protein VLX29_10880 [Nitrospirota bacterium]|nr:hypothetical protein [Nitrospirota bacterium]